MVAKISFESTWNETQMAAEIYALFHHLFEGEGSNESFQFSVSKVEISSIQPIIYVYSTLRFSSISDVWLTFHLYYNQVLHNLFVVVSVF